MNNQSINVDLTTNCITVDGNEIHLPPQEAELAHTLIKAMPHGARKAAIIIALWGSFERQDPDTHIKVLAHNLRRKLERFGISIKVVHGVGYRMLRERQVAHAA